MFIGTRLSSILISNKKNSSRDVPFFTNYFYLFGSIIERTQHTDRNNI